MGSGPGLGVSAAPFTYVAHALSVVAAVMVVVWCVSFRGGLAFEATNKQLIFNIHPVLMLIGFIILGSEAIISYKVLPFSKQVNKVVHLTLHAIALALGIVGIYAAFKYHNESAIVNLYSLHSWLGIGTICLYGVQWVLGLVAFFYPGTSQSVRRDFLPWHVVLGLFVYVLAIITASLGFLEKLTFLESSGLDKYGTEAFLVNFNALVVILLGASVFLAAVSPKEQEQEQSQVYVPIAEA